MQNLKQKLSTSTLSLNPEVEAQQEPEAVPVVERPATPDIKHRRYHLRAIRYYRIVLFFGLLFFRLILWEVVIRRLIGDRIVAGGRPQRWRQYSRQFRKLATDMGGVMIKLGQFISTRVDVLPPEITDELQGLQDQVPVVPFEYIQTTIEREIGPISEHFLWLTPEPVAAASFGQVHRGQLKSGERVVVKVQRPNLTDLVHTDLSALGVVARVAMRWNAIRRRANIPELLDEFSRVLWEELDYLAEADHALTFASMFANDSGIYVPAVYLSYSTSLVLTLEDVTSIKINDYKAIEEAGIDRHEVASRLLNCYLHQVFDVRFFHADPHPGNLFIYPLPQSANGVNGKAPGKREFYLIFIDFGMVGRLTPKLQEGLRDTLIAVVTQDAQALVASYEKIGVLMPGTDMARLEEATRAVFAKVWGLNMEEMANMPFDEMTNVAREFSDLLVSMPFQMPQDFIYLSRAVGILSGMCTGLDPRFDPWREMQPYTQRLLGENTTTTSPINRATLDLGLKVVRDFVTKAYKLPSLADNVLSRADRGELQVRMLPDDALKQQMNRIENTTSQLTLGIVFSTLSVVSTLLYVNQEQNLGLVGYAFSGLTLLLILIRSRG
jgi:predicted unusual protein kinase regulating ubiquinone biosynthesis (AarF/ABC1/UbiB family)